VQGLGYVGAAMATAVAHVSDEEGNRIYDVVGIDLPDETGRHRVESIKCGDFPFATTDEKLSSALSQAHVAGNITATTDETILSKADIVVVDVQLDLVFGEEKPRLRFEEFEGAIRTMCPVEHTAQLFVSPPQIPQNEVLVSLLRTRDQVEHQQLQYRLLIK
jgi:UDP-N-acetyl-D-mannosaminuronate dehydrogenase